MSTRVELIIIAGESELCWWMRAVDVFDSGKVLGRISCMCIDFKEGEIVDFERIEKLIPTIKKGLEDIEKQLVTFIYLDRIVQEDVILINHKQ